MSCLVHRWKWNTVNWKAFEITMESSRPKSHTGDYSIKRRFGKGFRYDFLVLLNLYWVPIVTFTKQKLIFLKTSSTYPLLCSNALNEQMLHSTINFGFCISSFSIAWYFLVSPCDQSQILKQSFGTFFPVLANSWQ